MPFDKTVFLPLDPDAVFELITQPERLRRWKTVAARVDLRVGGAYRWTILPGRSAAGTFTEIEPGKRVVFSWGWEGVTDLPPGASTVSITLDAVDGGTNVRLVHDGLTEEQTASHARGWAHYLGRLVELGATGEVGADEWAAAPDPIDELTSAEATLAILQRVLRGLTESDLGARTSFEDHTVGELVDHLYRTIAGVGSALGADVTETSGASAEVRIANVAQATLEAFRKRGLEGTIQLDFASVPATTVPATTVANILNLEFLVHAWDAALGRNLEVAPALSDYVVAQARASIGLPASGNAPAGTSGAGLAGESAASLERLLAFSESRSAAG